MDKTITAPSGAPSHSPFRATDIHTVHKSVSERTLSCRTECCTKQSVKCLVHECRDNKGAAAEFRELIGLEFEKFTRQAPVNLLLALSKFSDPMDMTVLQFADEKSPLFQRQLESLVRALRATWQRKAPDTAERRRRMTEVVRRLRQ